MNIHQRTETDNKMEKETIKTNDAKAKETSYNAMTEATLDMY